MALIKDPLDAIEDVSNAREAARLRDDLKQTLSTQPGLSPKWRSDAKQAIEWAENEYPEVKAKAFGQGRAEGLGPQARRYKQSGAATTRTGKNKPAKTPATSGKRPKAAAAKGAGRAAARGANRRVDRAASRSRGRVDRAVEQTGLPGVGRSATALSLQVLGVVVGLSFLYLLLIDAKRRPGRSAVETISKGVSTGVQLLVNPVDPFAGRGEGVGGIAGIAGADAPAGADAGKTAGRKRGTSDAAGLSGIAGIDGRSTVRRRRRPAHAPRTSTRREAAGGPRR